jgi:hypothetical protein
MFVTGGIIALFLYLQFQGISTVNVQKLADASTYLLSVVSSSFDKITQLDTTISLGFPLNHVLDSRFYDWIYQILVAKLVSILLLENSSKKRRSFSPNVKSQVTNNQNGKCA